MKYAWYGKVVPGTSAIESASYSDSKDKREGGEDKERPVWRANRHLSADSFRSPVCPVSPKFVAISGAAVREFRVFYVVVCFSVSLPSPTPPPFSPLRLVCPFAGARGISLASSTWNGTQLALGGRV